MVIKKSIIQPIIQIISYDVVWTLNVRMSYIILQKTIIQTNISLISHHVPFYDGLYLYHLF